MVKMIREQELTYTTEENINNYNHVGEQFGSNSKANDVQILQPTNSTSRFISYRNSPTWKKLNT